MFLRNPSERLLSAYLDKVSGMKRDKDHFLMNYNMSQTPSFEEFVNIISQNRVDFELGSKTKEKLQGVDWRKFWSLPCLIHSLFLDSTQLPRPMHTQLLIHTGGLSPCHAAFLNFFRGSRSSVHWTGLRPKLETYYKK